jgi:hypothetical protein
MEIKRTLIQRPKTTIPAHGMQNTFGATQSSRTFHTHDPTDPFPSSDFSFACPAAFPSPSLHSRAQKPNFQPTHRKKDRMALPTATKPSRTVPQKPLARSKTGD